MAAAGLSTHAIRSPNGNLPTHYEPFADPLGSRSYSCIIRLTPACSAMPAPCSRAYPGYFAGTLLAEDLTFAQAALRYLSDLHAFGRFDSAVVDGVSEEGVVLVVLVGVGGRELGD